MQYFEPAMPKNPQGGMVNLKKVGKYFFILYILIIPLAPTISAGLRLDYSFIFIFIVFLLYAKLKLVTLYPIIFAGLLSILSTSLFIFSGHSAEIYQLLINFFGLVRVALIMLIGFHLLNTRIVGVESLYNYAIISLTLLVIIAFLQKLYPSLNDILVKYYSNEYRDEQLGVIFAADNIRLTSTVGHPSGVGLATIILFASFLNRITNSRNNYRFLYVILMFLSVYVGVYSGSKIFYLGIIIYLFYVSIEQRAYKFLTILLLFISFFLYQFILLIDIVQLEYIYNFIIDNGVFGVLATRFGEEGLLTTSTLPFLYKSYFLGSGLFDAPSVFYGDSLYLMLTLRFSFIGALVFTIYFIYIIYKLKKFFFIERNTIALAISHIIVLFLLSGIGSVSIFISRISELFAVFWAIGLFIIYSQKEVIRAKVKSGV